MSDYGTRLLRTTVTILSRLKWTVGHEGYLIASGMPKLPSDGKTLLFIHSMYQPVGEWLTNCIFPKTLAVTK